MQRKSIETADTHLHRYYPVLDTGFVALVDYMGGDESIEQYARVSYGQETRKISTTRGLIRYLVRHYHSTPIESTELAFHIALPIHVARQLVRHRTFSPINEYSARYSVMPDLQYTPKLENFCGQSSNNKQGRDDTQNSQYGAFMKEIGALRVQSSELYHKMLNAGVAREIARMDLPLSTYTYWYCKMDLNNLFKMLRLRLDHHAQWEIRQYAAVIAGLAKAVAPIAFEAFVDYQLCASSFTRLDKEFHQHLLEEYSSQPAKLDGYSVSMKDLKDRYEEQKESSWRYQWAETQLGMSKRELDDFWPKFDVVTPDSYDLDVAKSFDAQHYADIVAAASRESV